MVNGSTTVGGASMFADMLDAPVSKLPVSDNVDVGEYFLDARTLEDGLVLKFGRNKKAYLVIFQAVLKDVLHDQTASLSQGHLVPHAPERIIDVLHNLRWRLCPTEFKELLPNVASVAVDHCLGDSTQKFMDHDCLVVLWDRVKGFLNDMAAKRVHRETQSVSTNSLSNLDDLFGSAVFKATLHQEVTEAIDHQRIGLGHDGLHDFVLLFRSTNLQLLLQKDGCLLVIVADDLVNDVLPVAVDIAVQQTAVVEWLRWWKVGLSLRGSGLFFISGKSMSWVLESCSPHSSRQP